MRFAELAETDIDADAAAWVFPDIPGPRLDGHIYPGTAVWIREVKRSKAGRAVFVLGMGAKERHAALAHGDWIR